MKNAGKARSYGLYRHLRTSKEIIENLLNYLYKKTKKLIHPIMTALDDGFILKIPPIPDKTPHRGYNSFRPQ